MNRKTRLSFGFGLFSLLFAVAAGPPAPGIAPADLTKRPDLIGREVTVDDRVAFFQFHKGRDYDELFLKRTNVVFRLPLRLRFEHAPDAPAARVSGTLQREGDLWYCDVDSLELFPSDLKRLNQAMSALTPRDFEGRTAWAGWAEQRGRAFKDQALLDRSKELESEAIRLEEERPSARPAEHWLSLAQRARDRGLAEPEPSALAHRAFRFERPNSPTADDLKTLQARIESFFPTAPKVPGAAVGADLAKWEAPYANAPSSAYRQAPPPVRVALDHRLWADVAQALLEKEGSDDPDKAIELADQAADLLPDRPKVATRLLEDGLQVATRKIGTLRQRDVQALAVLYREKLHQPERAKELLRSWLDELRHHRLSATDAEGRVALAQQYETLINDRSTAIELLQDAWKIDPKSKEIADAFLQRGHRKINDQWVEPSRSRAADMAGDTDKAAPTSGSASGSLLRLSPREVRVRLGGKPDRVVRSASQGQMIEQWIYFGARQDQYINLLHTPGDPFPRVVAHYSLPRTVFNAPAPR